MKDTDISNWRRFCRGDQHAFEQIYLRYKDKMYSYCLYVSRDKQLSEDVVQESFTRLLSLSDNTRKIQSPANWLFICARNLILNHLSSSKSAEKNVASITNNVTEPISVEARLFIDSLLCRLESEERGLILLREYQQFSMKELADMLDTNEGAIRIRLFRIRQKLQRIRKELE